MGMYDMINGEQVKCFSWVSLYNNKIEYHGGDLKGYSIGDEVPYKKPHYNYGKNFIIFDLNKHGTSFNYNYIIHVIVDGKVINTFRNKIGKIDWTINETVVGYTGELLNIHCNKDISDYIAARRKYWEEDKHIRSHWMELFKESMRCFTGIALLDKNSEERKIRQKKMEEIQKLIDEEKNRIEPQLNRLNKEHSKWLIDTSDIDDVIHLGKYISAYKIKSNAKEQCKEVIQKMLHSDSNLYNKYVEWQNSDEYIQEFALPPSLRQT